MLSAVLNHYARYQLKKKKGGREDEESMGTQGDLDSIYKTSVNGSGIEFLVKDPICRGYLLDFCLECYNSESMLFLIEVERFREALKNDKGLWTKSWQEIDANLHMHPERVYEWRSHVPIESVKAHMQSIYATYISDGADHQICAPFGVLQRTLNRMEHVEAYGRDTFHEISIDPMRTLERDILPRFVVSERYRILCEKLDLITHLPTGNELVVDPPREATDLNVDLNYGDDKCFTLDEIISSRFLYDRFLAFLQVQVNSENLLCKRLIILFKEKINKRELSEASTIAWNIYRFFVAASSAYEVSLEYSQKSELKSKLAKPTENMFDHLERSVTSMLLANYDAYRQSIGFRELGALLKADVRRREAEMQAAEENRTKTKQSRICIFG